MVQGRRTVRIPALSARLVVASDDHLHDVVRELQLMVIGADNGEAAVDVPHRLLGLIDTMLPRFTGVREAIRRQAEQALQQGHEVFDLVLDLPADGAGLGEQFLVLLDEADEYSKREVLLTTAPPPEVGRFRHQLVENIIRQLQ